MLKKFALVLFFFAMFNQVQATLFFPMPFEKQVEEATSAVEVKLDSIKVFKNTLGTIMTEYNFDVLEAYNLAKDDLENNKLKLTMPGGTFEGISSMIDGAPQFAINERSFLLLKKVDSKIYLSNFTLGKFKIENRDGKTMYVSEVFPTDPKIGQIAKDKMIELMEEKWKTSFSFTPENMIRPMDEPTAKVARAVFKSEEKRGPAQEEAPVGVPFFFWGSLFAFVLMFSVIFFKIFKNGAPHKSE